MTCGRWRYNLAISYNCAETRSYIYIATLLPSLKVWKGKKSFVRISQMVDLIKSIFIPNLYKIVVSLKIFIDINFAYLDRINELKNLWIWKIRYWYKSVTNVICPKVSQMLSVRKVSQMLSVRKIRYWYKNVTNVICLKSVSNVICPKNAPNVICPKSVPNVICLKN